MYKGDINDRFFDKFKVNCYRKNSLKYLRYIIMLKHYISYKYINYC